MCKEEVLDVLLQLMKKWQPKPPKKSVAFIFLLCIFFNMLVKHKKTCDAAAAGEQTAFDALLLKCEQATDVM